MGQPKWWKDNVVPMWEEAKPEVVASWGRVVGVTRITDSEMAERALAMGFQARQAFEDPASWDEALEERLRGDWALMNQDEHGFPSWHHEVAWEKVADAVKYGWESSPNGAWTVPLLAPTEVLDRE